MTQSVQPLQLRHEVEIHQRRTERNSEDLKLTRLKARLQETLKQQQPQVLARAS